ncbi:MAG: methyl-accepting chemotaxis protein, partial [Proteobacteria bacterium]|nr:methyl-accepting chemotaxis protein [Pseudomonadota bacterium]
MRKLAEKTVGATREIAETILSIQAEAQRAVEEMDAGHRAVAEGRGMGARAGEAVHAIDERVSRASAQTGQIAQATGQLSETIRDLASNMEEMARGAALNAASVADLAST